MSRGGEYRGGVRPERRGDVEGDERGGSSARARKVEAAPSKKEVKDRNLDHAVFRSWCLPRVKSRAEACGHRKREEV